jgi:tRNA(Ile)-lysidine synthase
MPKACDLDYDMIQIAIDVLSGSTRSGSAEVGAGIRAWLEGEQFYLAIKDAELPMVDWPQLEVESVRLEIPGKVALKQGWELVVERCIMDETLWERIRGNRDPFQCWLDARGLSTGLNVRSRRPGDRFQPLGMNGRHVKLAEVMVNLKIPSRARVHWPLVCSQETIVWLPGYLPAHPWRVSRETEQVVFLRIKRPKRDRR